MLEIAMKLIVIRHGRAGTPAQFKRSGMSDDLRPLTVEGRKRMRNNADGLAVLIPQIDAMGTSPLVRAVETAQIVAKVYGKLSPSEVKELSPGGDPAKVIAWISKHPKNSTVAIVGHEPTLSMLVTWLVSGSNKPFFELKKGGACSVELPDKVAAGAGELNWLMTPRQLRRFSR
jgi:phosphohistidine phosphatase